MILVDFAVLVQKPILLCYMWAADQTSSSFSPEKAPRIFVVRGESDMTSTRRHTAYYYRDNPPLITSFSLASVNVQLAPNRRETVGISDRRKAAVQCSGEQGPGHAGEVKRVQVVERGWPRGGQGYSGKFLVLEDGS